VPPQITCLEMEHRLPAGLGRIRLSRNPLKQVVLRHFCLYESVSAPGSRHMYAVAPEKHMRHPGQGMLNDPRIPLEKLSEAIEHDNPNVEGEEVALVVEPRIIGPVVDFYQNAGGAFARELRELCPGFVFTPIQNGLEGGFEMSMATDATQAEIAALIKGLPTRPVNLQERIDQLVFLPDAVLSKNSGFLGVYWHSSWTLGRLSARHYASSLGTELSSPARSLFASIYRLSAFDIPFVKSASEAFHGSSLARPRTVDKDVEAMIKYRAEEVQGRDREALDRVLAHRFNGLTLDRILIRPAVGRA
jgi:hypothetical protein